MQNDSIINLTLNTCNQLYESEQFNKKNHRSPKRDGTTLLNGKTDASCSSFFCFPWMQYKVQAPRGCSGLPQVSIHTPRFDGSIISKAHYMREENKALPPYFLCIEHKLPPPSFFPIGWCWRGGEGSSPDFAIWFKMNTNAVNIHKVRILIENLHSEKYPV